MHLLVHYDGCMCSWLLLLTTIIFPDCFHKTQASNVSTANETTRGSLFQDVKGKVKRDVIIAMIQTTTSSCSKGEVGVKAGNCFLLPQHE